MVNNINMWLDSPQLKLFVIRGELKAGCYLFKIVDLWECSWLYIGFFYIDLFVGVKYLSGSAFFDSLSKDPCWGGGGRLAFLYTFSVEMNIWISYIETVESRNKCKEDHRIKLWIYENHLCELQGEELIWKYIIAVIDATYVVTKRKREKKERRRRKKKEKSVSAAGVNTAVIIKP